MVPDASALVEYLLGTRAGRNLVSLLTAPGRLLHVPALCDVEVAAGLRRARIQGDIDDARLGEALLDYLDLPLRRHPHEALLFRVLELRHNLSAYDAAYAALAEALDAELLTLDRRLAKAVKAHTEVPAVRS